MLSSGGVCCGGCVALFRVVGVCRCSWRVVCVSVFASLTLCWSCRLVASLPVGRHVGGPFAALRPVAVGRFASAQLAVRVVSPWSCPSSPVRSRRRCTCTCSLRSPCRALPCVSFPGSSDTAVFRFAPAPFGRVASLLGFVRWRSLRLGTSTLRTSPLSGSPWHVARAPFGRRAVPGVPFEGWSFGRRAGDGVSGRVVCAGWLSGGASRVCGTAGAVVRHGRCVTNRRIGRSGVTPGWSGTDGRHAVARQVERPVHGRGVCVGLSGHERVVRYGRASRSSGTARAIPQGESSSNGASRVVHGQQS